MARYIDADALSEEIDKAQMSLASNDDIVWERNKKYYKGLCWARSLVNEQPTADVVPKSEVEELTRENESLAKTVNEASELIRKLRSKIAELKKKHTGE